MRKRSAKDVGKTNDLFKAAKAFEGFRPASQVLSVVRAVPTQFIQFDHATKVGGCPIERFGVIHGPSSHGKTTFALGLEDSFLERGHLALHVDAERTTPITWARQYMKNADSPRFFALRPQSYEQTVAKVREFVLTLKRQRDEGKLPENTSAIIIVDSIRKLVPEGIFDKIMAEAKSGGNKSGSRGGKKKAGVDGMGGRAAQIKAALNASWLDELTPLLEETGTAFMAIARETKDGDANQWQKRAGTDFKIGGGDALIYDSSMVIRVERDRYVDDGKGGDDGDGGFVKAKIYGQRHCVTIRKTKVAGQTEKQTRCYFHSSNGVMHPEGFDPARDLLEIAEKFGTIEKSGSWYSFFGEKLGNGKDATIKALYEQPETMKEIEKTVRASFMENAPVEFDEDGVLE